MTRKVIFDTNLWSDIGDEGGLADLRRAVEELDCLVVCWPSLRVTTTEDLCVTEGEYEQSGPCAAAW